MDVTLALLRPTITVNIRFCGTLSDGSLQPLQELELAEDIGPTEPTTAPATVGYARAAVVTALGSRLPDTSRAGAPERLVLRLEHTKGSVLLLDDSVPLSEAGVIDGCVLDASVTTTKSSLSPRRNQKRQLRVAEVPMMVDAFSTSQKEVVEVVTDEVRDEDNAGVERKRIKHGGTEAMSRGRTEVE